MAARPGIGKFQFPARNSVCSDEMTEIWQTSHDDLFQFPARNSVCSDLGGSGRARQQSGMFQFPARNSVCSDISIPLPHWRLACSFNSPLGILFVRTRDLYCHLPHCKSVSIPRSEFCLFGLVKQQSDYMHNLEVSIPRSEFCLFGRRVNGC